MTYCTCCFGWLFWDCSTIAVILVIVEKILHDSFLIRANRRAFQLHGQSHGALLFVQEYKEVAKERWGKNRSLLSPIWYQRRGMGPAGVASARAARTMSWKYQDNQRFINAVFWGYEPKDLGVICRRIMNGCWSTQTIWKYILVWQAQRAKSRKYVFKLLPLLIHPLCTKNTNFITVSTYNSGCYQRVCTRRCTQTNMIFLAHQPVTGWCFYFQHILFMQGAAPYCLSLFESLGSAHSAALY